MNTHVEKQLCNPSVQIEVFISDINSVQEIFHLLYRLYQNVCCIPSKSFQILILAIKFSFGPDLCMLLQM